MAKKKLDSPELYINRELSWLEFNQRVLDEGLCPDLPLLERLKFLAIVSSNLDEFFMIRVAGLMQQRSAGVRRRDISGLTPAQQLARIAKRVHKMVDDQSAGITEVLAEMRDRGLSVLEAADWRPEQERFLRSHFSAEILPILTPLAVQDLDPCPLLPNLRLNVVAVLADSRQERGGKSFVFVPVPARLPRFITIPGESGVNLARLEDVIARNLDLLWPDRSVLGAAYCRITRDADVAIQDDDASDLLHAVETAVLDRRRRAAVRLVLSRGADRDLKRWLTEWMNLRTEDVYEVPGMLDAAALMEVANRPGFEELKAQEWPPRPPRDLVAAGPEGGEPDDLWSVVRDRDVLLFHPYESFEPVVRLMNDAAEDSSVLAIKQTLYRTSGDSPVIRALARAAENGKEVTVLVELKARFDEARNVQWARRLEDAGCHVIYGIAGYKTHSKALLIVRREGGRMQRYVHLATGNYNDRTAKLYSDIGMMTTDRETAGDVAAFFNLLTGASEEVGWSQLTIAPTGMRQRFYDLIDREVQASTPDQPGRIMAKVNSLYDKGICKALYEASRAGVDIRLNVRGICCLRPGLDGVSPTIHVRSIVDRFLEHARIFYFRNGGHEEVYLGSADWMTRNLDKRLEILFPVRDAGLRRRLVDALEVYFADNVKARELLPDGTYRPVRDDDPPVRAQERLYQEAVEAERDSHRAAVRFRPLTGPE